MGERHRWEHVREAAPPAPGAVHIWRVPSLAPAPDARRLLDVAERERAGRLRGDARLAFEATRAALRRTLGSYLGRDPRSLRFRYGPRGKPALHGAGADAIRFSVSHSGPIALLAFTGSGDVGVDVERVRPVARLARIAARLFDPGVQALLAGLEEPERTRAFMTAWTQREAHVKAVGAGMLELRPSLRCVWPPPDRPLVERLHAEAGASWSVVCLEPGPGYLGACVAQGELSEVRLFE
jgi:4'-phosphopantetheinyl transferase